MQLGEAEGTVGVGDVAKDTAGADRGELLIISDQADTCTAADGELDCGVEGEGVGHAGFIDDQQGRPPNCCRPVGQFTVPQRPGEFGEGVGADAGLLGKNSGCGSGRGEAEHVATVLGPGQGDGTHGGGLPGAGRCDRELQPGIRRAHLPDQCGLPSIECGAVRRHLEHGQIHHSRINGRTAALSSRGEETQLSVEDPLRRVEVGAGDGVDRRPVDPPQRLRFLDVVSRCGQGNTPAIEHLIDQQVHQGTCPLDRHIRSADLAL